VPLHRSASPGGSALLLPSLGRSLICPPGPAGMLAWPPAFHARVRFGFSCLANFGWGQNSPNTMRPQPRPVRSRVSNGARKNSLNNSFFFFWRRNIFLKKYIFNSFRVGEGKRIKDVAKYRFIGMRPDDCDCQGRRKHSRPL